MQSGLAMLDLPKRLGERRADALSRAMFVVRWHIRNHRVTNNTATTTAATRSVRVVAALSKASRKLRGKRTMSSALQPYDLCRVRSTTRMASHA